MSHADRAQFADAVFSYLGRHRLGEEPPVLIQPETVAVVCAKQTGHHFGAQGSVNALQGSPCHGSLPQAGVYRLHRRSVSVDVGHLGNRYPYGLEADSVSPCVKRVLNKLAHDNLVVGALARPESLRTGTALHKDEAGPISTAHGILTVG
ncbi:MAG: hypothetical protein F4Z93_03185 [Rhodospirillales bacterium]|nr:hypothetical protein [Rhodospirillales bacterium]